MKKRERIMPSKYSTKSFLASGTFFFPFNPIVLPVSEAIFLAQVKPTSPWKDNVIHPRHKPCLIENGRPGSSAKPRGAQPDLPHGRRAHCRSTPHLLDVLQERVTGPAMWAAEGMGAVGIVQEMEETSEASKSQTDGMASL